MDSRNQSVRTDVSQSPTARVLFLARTGCDISAKALTHLEQLGWDVTCLTTSARGEQLPESVEHWQGEYIICFRSLAILRKPLLDRATIAAINFHPGPVEYPGSGCINFALYDDAKNYGVTAHLMNEKVDNGRILECRRFPILKEDTLDSLLARTHLHCFELLVDITSGLARRGADYLESMLAKSAHESWSGEAKRMIQLEQLKTIPVDVSRDEIERIVRATYTELYPPRIRLHGFEFLLKL